MPVDKMPILDNSIRILEEEGFYFISMKNSIIPSYRINETAFMVLKMCNGKTDMDSMLDNLAEIYDFSDRYEISSEIESFIKAIKKINIIK